MEHRAARGRMDEADEVAPFKAVLHRGERALAVKTPDVVQDRLQANAVLVDGPQLDGRLWKGRCHLPQQGAQAGLKLGLGSCVSPYVAGPWFQPAGAEPSQVTPAQLTADAPPETLGQPLGNGASAPAVALGMETR